MPSINYKAIIDAIPLIVGAVRPGSVEATGIMQGYQQAEDRRRLQAQQDAQQQSRLATEALQRQLTQAQIANLPMANANQYAARTKDMRSANATDLLSLLDQSQPPVQPSMPVPSAQSVLTRTPMADPSSPGLSGVNEATQLQQDYIGQKFDNAQANRVAGDSTLPNASALLSARDKKVLAANLKAAETDPLYQGLIKSDPASFDRLTIQTRSGQLIPVSEARRQIGGGLMTPSGAPVAPTPAIDPMVVDVGGQKVVVDRNALKPGQTFTETPNPRQTPVVKPVESARNALRGAMLAGGDMPRAVTQQLVKAGLDPSVEIARERKDLIAFGKTMLTDIERASPTALSADELIARARQALVGASGTPAPATPPPGSPQVGQTPPPTVQRDAIVTLKDKRRVRVTKTYPDGTFDYEVLTAAPAR